MHQPVESPPSAAEKRDAFENFYSGWSAFMQDRPDVPPGERTPKEKDLFHQGHAAAALAAERFKAGKDG